MHICDNRKCVNPAHLVLGTQAANVADMDNKARRKTVAKSGASHRNAKLTAEQVEQVMQSDERHAVLAAQFGVTPETIKRIRLGLAYKQESGGIKQVRPRFRATGAANPGAKLTFEQVKHIRESPKTTHALAAEMRLSQPTIASARRGATYKDVDVPIPVIKTGRPKRPTG